MDSISINIIDINLFLVVSKVNLVSNAKDWWVDKGATRHICVDKDLLTEHKKINQYEHPYMDNSAFNKIDKIYGWKVDKSCWSH